MNRYHRELKRRSGGSAAMAGLFLAFLLLSCFPPAMAGAAERSASLVGRVLPTAGIDAAGRHVVIMHLDTQARLSATTRADGTFTLEGVPAGRVAIVVEAADPAELPEAAQVVDIRAGHRNEVTLTPQAAAPPHPQGTAAPTFNFLLYKGEYYNNKTSEAAADPVTVTAPATTSNINLDLSTGGGTIAGRVTADGTNAALPGLVVFAIGRSSFIISFDRTDNNGDYKITGVPADSFLVSVNTFFTLDENDYIGEYYNNSLSTTGASSVQVAEGQNVTGVNFGLAKGGAIAGTVTAEVGGAALAMVAVTAQGGAPLFLGDLVLTDAAGHYTIRGLAAGNYTLHFQPEGDYLPEYHNNKASSAAADPVAVAIGGTTTINAQLAPAGAISGRLTNSSNSQPLADELVIASKVGDAETVFYEYTATDGTYRVEGMPAGSYIVSAPELNKWYDNKDSEETANPVAVVVGSTTSNIDISGVPFAGGCSADPGSRVAIGGLVTSAGQPVEDADVYLYLSLTPVSPGFPTRYVVNTTTTGADGRYLFDCIDEATYFVECAPAGTDLIAQWFSNADSAGATAVAVSAGNSRSDIDFALQHGGRIAGKVTGGGGGTNLASVYVRARNVANGRVFDGFTDQSGNYVIQTGDQGGLASGAYKVWIEEFTTANFGLLPVVLSRFEALPIAGGIAVEWTTSEETDHAGFHVYRSTSPQGAAVRLTDRLLTGGPGYRFEDTQTTSGLSYWYWLAAVDRGGREERFGPVTASFGEPAVTKLLGVFPNPLHAQSIIHFSLAAPGKAKVQIFDPAGRLVRSLAGADYPAGRASVAWDGRRDDGTAARAGVYFVQLSAGGALSTTKLIVAR